MKKHILIVDDEPDIRELLSEFLGSVGYKVAAVSSQAGALEAVRAEAPHLIISDLQLEDADGLQMIARLKTMLPGVPVILLTGVLFDPKAVNNVLLSKVSCYLDKTSSLAMIHAAIRRLIPESSAA
jgi:two-component system OmpR family response regulator